VCGICGFAGRGGGAEDARALLRQMTAAIVHRGPDDSGHFVSADGSVGLGHRRLSIIDLAGGHQPMENEDGSVRIAFNGEIYNFQELKKRLEGAGHVFRTNSDTEVIVHLYEEEGPDCVTHLRGMFAFAIWDEPRGRLLLARDRLGQKPCYYLESDGALAFASELKSILVDPGVPRRVNPLALDRYLTYQYVPHPMTMFDGISKLPPAHIGIWEKGSLSVRRYWLPEFDREEPLSEGEYVERTRALVDEATRMRMISDVPLGAFLSGGMDSSITVALMALASTAPVKTFSIGFREKKFNETDYARQVARRYETDHTEFVVEPRCLEVLGALAWHYDEPFADSSAIPTWYVSKMTREKVTVALSGDAGDENFAGYPRYRAVKLASLYDRMPGVLKAFFHPGLWRHLPVSVEQKSMRRRARKLVMALNLPPEERYLTWIAIYDEARKTSLYNDGFRERLAGRGSAADFVLGEYARAPRRDFVSRTTFVDLMTYLPCDLLTKVDIASMAHSLEVRTPFLDHEVIELAAAMPAWLKLRRLNGKYILKKAFADLLPRDIITRPKMGFGVPISRWFRTELAGFVRRILLDDATLERGYFRPAALRQLLDEHTEGVFDHGYRIWALLMLELWHRTFIDEVRTGPLEGLEALL
jgi:asparagine synthase (glutamine-hydrolysing)